MSKCCEKNETLQDARISQNAIASVYDKLASLYDIWGKATESRARSRAIELANVKDGQNVLEVAVGTGLAFYEIVKRNPNGINTGIDLSEGMLKVARQRLENLQEVRYELKQGSAFQLDLENESVDILLIIICLI